MRNLVVHREVQLAVAASSRAGISCVSSDNTKGVLVACTSDGRLVEVPLSEGLTTEWDMSSLAEDEGEREASWFFCSAVIDDSSLLCVSRAGQIASIHHSSETGQWELVPEAEGFVDSGIRAAQWNPDQSSLVLCTGDGSLIAMSPELDVLHEVALPPTPPDSACAVSWSGDGEMCAVCSVDASDGVARVRVFSKRFELLATGRGVAEGAAGTVRDLCVVVAFAPNASLVAGVQKKPAGKYQVVFFERNGLRHGEYDVQLDSVVTAAAPLSSWAPASLFFDLSSTTMAVSFRSSCESGCNSVVQLYYRENFHWYLKQQWSGTDLSCHGFDAEVSGRLFLSEAGGGPVLRSIDLVWEATASPTGDCTIAVTDGAEVLLTPLGHAVVPPPMSLYRTPRLTAAPRHLSFWTKRPLEGADPCESAPVFPEGWGITCLCDRNVLFLFTGEPAASTRATSPLLSSGPLQLDPLLATAGLVGGACRQALALERRPDGAAGDAREVGVVLVVSSPRVVSAGAGGAGFGQSFTEDLSQGVLLFVQVVLSNADANETPSMRYMGTLTLDRCTVTSLSHWGAEGHSLPDHDVHDAAAFSAGDDPHIAVAVSRADSSFAVIRVKTPFFGENQSASQAVLVEADAAGCSHIIPELCHKVVVAVPKEAQSLEASGAKDFNEAAVVRRSAVIGLSVRNHLYCGEILLATGVSTFCLNSPLGGLLYATVGTRPTLNFIDIEALHRLDPMQSIDEQVHYWGVAEPRPLERGARLVASVPAAARVVLQMPRGNFETCEPRHLALKRAKLMMESNAFFDCLVFLRRQRIDLNLLFDYCPTKFLAGASALVSQCLDTNPDLLSLLISSLEPGDVTRSKYSIDFTGVQSWAKNPIITHPDKVNIVCATSRRNILSCMIHSSIGNSASLTDGSKFVNPVLCTYARQHPPRLAEALRVIKAESMGILLKIAGSLSADPEGDESTGVDALAAEVERALLSSEYASVQPALSLGKPQALIKYLAFLVNKEDLFHAALGECDFSMARAIAKQCQMDPKHYLPLIENFESIGSEWAPSEGSEEDRRLKRLYHMKHCVYAHLGDFGAAAEWGIRAITLAEFLSGEHDVNNAAAISEAGLFNDVFEAIEKHDLHSSSIKQIRELLSGGSTRGGASSAELARLLSMVLVSYGSRAMALGNYRQAMTAFLTANPAELNLAAAAAKAARDWKLAISLAGRAALVCAQSPQSDSGSISTPRDIAESIVEEFETGLEQGMSEEEDYFASFPSALDFSVLSKVVEVSQAVSSAEGADEEPGVGAAADGDEDRSLEVAQLCVEYLDGDVDRAVAVLVGSRKWMHAAQMAFRYSRSDLVQQVGESVRAAAKEALAALQHRSARHIALCTNLKTCWGDVEGRLALIVESDPQLASIVERNRRPAEAGLGGPSALDDAGALGEARSVVNDLRSEYSRSSNLSFASGASVKSGVSTVSVLSNLSRASNTGSTVSDASSFSVRGLEHSLLSRGSAYDTSEGSKSAKSIEKKKKRHERHLKGNKGGAHGGADVYNLKGENAWCAELCQYCDIKVVADAVTDLRDALVVLGDPSGDIELAIRLQRVMTEYATLIVSNPPPPAPLYPVEWLRRKGMERVRCFQEWPLLGSDAVRTVGAVVNTTVSSLLWWKVAAEGIIYWRTLKNNVLDA